MCKILELARAVTPAHELVSGFKKLGNPVPSDREIIVGIQRLLNLGLLITTSTLESTSAGVGHLSRSTSSPPRHLTEDEPQTTITMGMVHRDDQRRINGGN